MRNILLFLIFFLLAPAVFADITITSGQHIYNLGDRIRVSASIVHSSDFEGLFKLTLSCENFEQEYFRTPVSLEQNFATAVDVPEWAAVESMLGNCTITGNLLSNDNLIIEGKSSDAFGITDQLTVLPVNSRITALPTDSLKIAGVINKAFGTNVLKASAKIALGNSSYLIDAVDGKFNMTFYLPKNIKSGRHTIEISASDPKDNFGSSAIELEVTVVPSYLKTDVSGNKLLPGSKVEIVSSIYDQADDLINDSLDLELTSPSGNNVFIKTVQSNEKIDYEFSQYAEPGIYSLASAYRDLSSKVIINITAVREVKIKYENETVFIENIGNVPFIDELTFFLESELEKYPITKKINVAPSRILSIDLSKEVPLGIYNILAPIKEGIEPLKNKLDESLQSVQPQEDESVLASNVTIHDNRPVYKKIATGVHSISGKLVGADGILARNPIIAPAILITILLLVIVRYGRKPIMRLIKGRKESKEEDKTEES